MRGKIKYLASAIVGLGFSVCAQADGGACSLRSLAGTFIVKCAGFAQNPDPSAPPGGPLVPFAELSHNVGHADGHCSGSGTVSVNGLIFAHTYSCVLPVTVNPDCTETVTIDQWLDGQYAGQTTFNGIINPITGAIEEMVVSKPEAIFCTSTRVSSSHDHDSQ